MGDLFVHRILDTGRLPLFCFFVAFIVTFVLTRVNVRLIRARVRWFKNVQAGDLHIHHVVFGVVLMLIGGVTSFATPDGYDAPYVIAAAVFGIGSALVLDEFALILHLRDVYWAEEGRASVDAVFVAVALTGLLLLGARPVGFAGVEDDTGKDSLLNPLIPPSIYLLSLVINLSLAVVTLLKGKIWTGLIGLFVPLFVYVGAIRVARPGSPWARWHYQPNSRRYRRALHREQRFRYPLIRGKIWIQEAIAGRHDLILADHLQRQRSRMKDEHMSASGPTPPGPGG